MAENTFGANIIEILTAGMYQDSKVIYREYIQNSCDQIDKAEKLNILRTRDPKSRFPDLGEGEVNIWLDPDERCITIEDNATGIKADDFQRTLLNIADSDKIMGEDKGFRGIGRLCGLAYCKQLIFTSRWNGEDVISVMICDAKKMREMINEANTKVKRHSAFDVIDAIADFKTRPANSEDPEHFFKVELLDINDENEELFGGKDENNLENLTDYLSFVAPVPYSADFVYRSEIYDYAKMNDLSIDEYRIKINGQQVFKKYKTRLKTGKGQDDVFGVKFHEFWDKDNTLLGWLWFGKTNFIAAIKEEEVSRGLRLRKENIQIGHDGTLRDMFTREISRRGNSYFIGEVFAVSKELIPNSQRSYFNENPTRIEFEHKLKDYFNHTLYHIYHEGSNTSSEIKKITTHNDKVAEFNEKVATGGFLTNEEQMREEKELQDKAAEAEKAYKSLKKKKDSGRSILSAEIVERRAKEIPVIVETKSVSGNLNAPHNTAKPSEVSDVVDANSYKQKQKFLVDSMFPQTNKKERKLLSETLDKIFGIIQKSADKKTSEKIINAIKDELR